MSDPFKDKEGRTIVIKVNPYTKEEIDNHDKELTKGSISRKVESWAFISREYKSDGGGVRSICHTKRHFNSELNAQNYLYCNGWRSKGNGFVRKDIIDGWSASEYATISCERVGLLIK